ncbi:hypothetical protein FA13DRAFT_1731396 [Coprinellus micaceus]|uniref:Uncharacterized protein n=1 Tax=Coprinellus micaceus TaxID=71717 RepID=A0A4Y7TFB3_COPMI|nr:hypothetical protein FA13DRAFT_1731396 [Coprinellus micaceus]
MVGSSFLERELLDLKQQRNNMSPISTLPPEILCEILLLATTCHDPEKYIGDLPDRLRIKGFFGVLGHVSHWWRMFALECPYLWADIDAGMNTDARRVEFQAKYALPHPLSLWVKGALATTSGPRPERPKAFDALQRVLSETKLFEKLAIEGDVFSPNYLKPHAPSACTTSRSPSLATGNPSQCIPQQVHSLQSTPHLRTKP